MWEVVGRDSGPGRWEGEGTDPAAFPTHAVKDECEHSQVRRSREDTSHSGLQPIKAKASTGSMGCNGCQSPEPRPEGRVYIKCSLGWIPITGCLETPTPCVSTAVRSLRWAWACDLLWPMKHQQRMPGLAGNALTPYIKVI